MNCFTFIFVKRLKWHGCTWRRTWKWTIEKTCLQENIDGKHICGKLWQDLHFASKACARKASVCWVHDVIEWKLKEASFSLHFLQSSNVIPGNSCCHLHWGWLFQRLMIQISDWKITICIQWLHLICWQHIYQVDLLILIPLRKRIFTSRLINIYIYIYKVTQNWLSLIIIDYH